MWNLIATAPFGRSLELAVMDQEGLHALVFPCEKVRDGWWRDTITGALVDIRPTHWREWKSRKDQTDSLGSLPESGSA
ncbi:hypothetical protein FJ974_06765 [Mesorhizobium sp. B1-1-8]|nr:hypothetical protein FJ974_06765 [Mesorhizobium sp. B1-1-8]